MQKDHKKTVDSELSQTIKLRGEYFQGIGRRKRAVAQVRLYKGKGKVYINDKEIKKPNTVYIAPLNLINKKDYFDISIHIKGGGKAGQLGAIRHGISRALLKYNKDLRQTLKKEGYLTRDPREKERKKPGLKSARRAPQWQKR